MKNNKFDLYPDEKRKMLDDIMYFFANELDDNIGDLKAHNVLEFILEEFGVRFYNKGIEDAKTFIQTQVEDIYSLEKIKDKKSKS